MELRTDEQSRVAALVSHPVMGKARRTNCASDGSGALPDLGAEPWCVLAHPAFRYYVRLGKIQTRVLADVAADWRVGRAAAVACLSPKYFGQYFISKVGVAFREWVHRARVLEAQRLLATRNLRVETLAARVGYVPRTFVRNFTRLVGLSPGTYRRRVEERLAEQRLAGTLPPQLSKNTATSGPTRSRGSVSGAQRLDGEETVSLRSLVLGTSEEVR